MLLYSMQVETAWSKYIKHYSHFSGEFSNTLPGSLSGKVILYQWEQCRDMVILQQFLFWLIQLPQTALTITQVYKVQQ